MLKKIIIFSLFFSLIALIPAKTFAKTYTTVTTNVKKTLPSPTPTPVPVVDSFDLFWPLVAGKTMQSKIYFLKTLKEDVRGLFIFGSAQKADYKIFLGIKRMLEAEVLMKAKVSDLANKTLDRASSDFDSAKSSLDSAKNGGDVDQGTKDEINNRVSNLKKFVSFLKVQYPDYNVKLQSILDKLNSIVI